jgi:hypothetical protein
LADAIRDRLQTALGTGYTLGRELGGGGMSRVWTAHDTTLGRDVVVKLLSHNLVQEMSVERFTREVRLAANLQHAYWIVGCPVQPGAQTYRWTGCCARASRNRRGMWRRPRRCTGVW